MTSRTALFTRVPVDKAFKVIEEQNLREDLTLPDRSKLNVDQLIQLLEDCLTTTYFVSWVEFHQQIHGAAMASPFSPVVEYLYIEHFVSIVFSSAPRTPSRWFRYIDDTFVLTHEYYVDSLISHIDNIGEYIKITISRNLCHFPE